MASPKPKDVQGLLRALAAGAGAAQAALAAMDSRRGDDRLAKRAREADRAYRAAIVRHQSHVANLKARVQVGWIGAAGLGGAAAVAAVPTGGASLVLLAPAAISAWWARTGQLRLHQVGPAPLAPAPPPPALPQLRKQDTGYAEVNRLGRAEVQLAGVLPAVATIHDGAAHELAQAADSAAPILRQQADRLALLAGLSSQLQDPEAVATARAAGAELQARLAGGVTAYERLIAAAGALLAAPDVGRSVSAIVDPAIAGMQAYTHGLATAAERLGDG